VTVVITGASAGIGEATARALAGAGHRLVLACRSEAKGQAVADAISRDTGNPAIEVVVVDLADLTSVRECAAALVARTDPVDVLINNAGVGGVAGLTRQGFEIIFGTNHLGHFLLTNLVMARPDGRAPSRVVNVSSDSHRQAKGIDFDACRRATESRMGVKEYAVSKLCNVLFTQELARRAPAATVVAVHPGVVASDIWRTLPRVVRPVVTRFMKSPEAGARTSVYCATASGLESGGYYAKSRPKAPSGVAAPALAAELWARSQEWVAGS
jgi:NAD(P)-dependent dehydrogenase (short-subunit alcohol dehydrogenase family)